MESQILRGWSALRLEGFSGSHEALGSFHLWALGRGNRHLHIDIAHEVVPKVVAHIHLFNLSILLLQFCEHLL